ncbi:hypothetical protein AAE478_009828 [Parahypoxylon ruwenzoriense]
MVPSGLVRYSASELLRIREGINSVPTVFLTHQLWERYRPSHWQVLFTQPVTGCWIAAREREVNYGLDGYLEERNNWVIVLELLAGQSVTIELKQVDAIGNTITVCRPQSPLQVVIKTSLDSIEVKFLHSFAYSFRIGVIVEVKVKDWLDRLQQSGVTRYVLDKNRGHRYWISSVLHQFQDFLDEDVPNLEDTEMSRVWELGGEVIVPGVESGSVGDGHFQAGRFLPAKWPKKSGISRSSTPASGGRAPNETPRHSSQRGQGRRQALPERGAESSPAAQSTNGTEQSQQTQNSTLPPARPGAVFYPQLDPSEPDYGVGIDAWRRFAQAHGAR